MGFGTKIAAVGTATLLSRLLGFARDLGIAAVLGAGLVSDAFFVVLQAVNFFRRLLSEGALNPAFVPIWIKLRSGKAGAAKADRFTRRSLVIIAVAMGFVAFLTGVSARPIIDVVAPGFDSSRRLAAALYLFSASPYILLAGTVALLAAALSAEGRATAVAISTVLFNVVMLVALLAAFAPFDPVSLGLLFTMAIVVAGLIQIVVTAAVWLFTGNRWQRVDPPPRGETRRFFARAVPGLIATGIPQLKLIAVAAIASTSPAAVAWLYYANRLYELPLGVASVSVSLAVVPQFAANVRHRNKRRLAAVQSRAFELALGVAVPAAVALIMLAQPIAGGLFERGAFGPHDTAAVAAALAAMAAGLPGHVLEKVLGAVAFAHEDTKTPMAAALCGLAVAIATGLLLFPRYGHAGAAAAIAISGWIGAAILAVILALRGWLRIERVAWRRVGAIATATAVMAVILFAGKVMLAPIGNSSTQAGRLAVLAILVTIGLGSYLGTIQALGAVRFAELRAALRKRL